MLTKVVIWVKKYQLWVIFGLAVIIASVLLIWAIISSQEKKQLPPVTLIELPLNNGVSHRSFIGREIVEGSRFPESLPVYKIIDKNYSSDIDIFLQQLNKDALSKSSVQGKLYTWVKDENYVQYIPNLQTLYFRFDDTPNPQINIRVASPDSGKEYFKEVFKKFFSRDYDFSNASVVQTGNRVRIEATRSVHGYPINLPTYSGYTDYIILDTNGGFVEGKLLLVEYELDDPEIIKLVHISNLQGAMNSADYPKTVVQGTNPIVAELSEEESHTNEDGEIHGDVTEEAINFPVATSSIISTAKIVYLFADSKSMVLSPVYKLNGEGTILYKGTSVQMPIIVYTSALIPERVYIPD